MAYENSTIAGLKQQIHQEVPRYKLGYGIDATSPNPWAREKDYEVLPIRDLDSVVIRNEGSLWKIYRHKIKTQQQLQTELTASLAVLHRPMSIGGGMDTSGENAFSCELYGRKLVKCRVYIRPDTWFSERKPDDFEAKLSSWIVGRIRHHANVAFDIMKKMNKVKLQLYPKDDELTKHMKELDLDDFAMTLALAAANHKLMEKEKQALEDELCYGQDAEHASTKHQQAEKPSFEQQKSEVERNSNSILDTTWDTLVYLCEEFVRTFNITHFVSAIELGAAEYQVVKETNEVIGKGSGASVVLPSIAKAPSMKNSEWVKFSKSTKTKKLGVIDENGEVKSMVPLERYILPITERVRTAPLRLALQRVLKDHIDKYYQDVDHQIQKGPFKISIKVDKTSLYLTVNEVHDPEETSVRAEQRRLEQSPHFDENNAIPIFLIPVEDGKENKFYLAYYKEPLPIQGGRFVPPPSSTSTPYYLQVDLNMLGHDKKVQFVAEPTKECHFEFKPSERSNVSSIFKDNISFYIKCHQHRRGSCYLYSSPDKERARADIHCSRDIRDEKFIFLFSLERITLANSSSTTKAKQPAGAAHTECATTHDKHSATQQSIAAVDMHAQ